MKKFVIFINFFLCVMLCGCSVQNSGYVEELTSNKWSATLKGGAQVSLCFNEEYADFEIENSSLSTSISGKYVADEKSFVIFVPEIAQNYTFVYTPKGEKLDLTYNNSTITLNRQDN